MKFRESCVAKRQRSRLIFCIVGSRAETAEFLLYLILIDFNFVPLRQTRQVLRRASTRKFRASRSSTL